MDFRNFKVVQKDKIDEAQDKIMDDVSKQNGFEKYYVLGEINILRMLIDALKNDGLLYRKDLIELLQSTFTEYDWTQEIVDAIVKKYE